MRLYSQKDVDKKALRGARIAILATAVRDARMRSTYAIAATTWWSAFERATAGQGQERRPASRGAQSGGKRRAIGRHVGA